MEHEVVGAKGFDGFVALGPTADHEVPEGQGGLVDLVEDVLGFVDGCRGECEGFEVVENGGRGRRVCVKKRIEGARHGFG